MKVIVKIGILLIFSVTLTACKDFIEPSIEDEKLELLAPGDGNESSNYIQHFWWEPLSDASAYRLQVVSGTFEKVLQLKIDTLIRTNKFMLTLEPGNYEWRVRGENGSSVSLYSQRSFRIVQSSLMNQKVNQIAPADHLISNQKDQLYSWEALFGAARYRLQIDTNSFIDESALVHNNTVSGTQLKLVFPADGGYQWRVRAESDTAVSGWSDVRTITFDSTPPDAVSLSSPQNNELTQKPVTLRWEPLSGIARYQLTVLKSDSVTVYNTHFPMNLTTNSYNFNEGTSSEKLYWKVRAFDEAGNAGPYSEVRNFTIQ